jgi:hypothetical protein
MVNILIHQFQPGGAVVDAPPWTSSRGNGRLTRSWSMQTRSPTGKLGRLSTTRSSGALPRPSFFSTLPVATRARCGPSPTPRLVTITESIFPSPRLSSQRTISRTCRSRSSLTMAISSRRSRGGRSPPTSRGAACRSNENRGRADPGRGWQLDQERRKTGGFPLQEYRSRRTELIGRRARTG